MIVVVDDGCRGNRAGAINLKHNCFRIVELYFVICIRNSVTFEHFSSNVTQKLSKIKAISTCITAQKMKFPRNYVFHIY